jgi:hypothetical protein
MKLHKQYWAILIGIGLLASSGTTWCESPNSGDAAVVVVHPSVTASPKPLLSRWFDISEMSHSERYRNTYDENGSRLFDNGQQRTVLSGRFKFDQQGRYFIGFRGSSGRFFNWAYSDYMGHDFGQHISDSIAHYTQEELIELYTALAADPTNAGGSVAANGWSFYMRDLYGSATPIKQVTVEFGSIQIERGYSTEITTFDDDGYIAGERIRIHDAKHLYFDEVGFTNAYFGDLRTPSFFSRGDRLTETNYRQVNAKKQINHRVGVSGEYNWVNTTNTTREAVVVKVPEAKLVDGVRLELYQRLNDITPQGDLLVHDAGFAVALDKKVGRVSGDAGYASIDGGYSGYQYSRVSDAIGFTLNGDSYGVGRRFYTHAAVRITPSVSAFGFYTHQVFDNDFSMNKQGLNAGLKFDLKALINSGKQVF